MAIPPDIAREMLAAYEPPLMRNLFAQADARHVLYEVGESEDNFPAFDPALTDKVTAAAYSLLAAGVSLAETEEAAEGYHAIEEAAVLINGVHQPLAGAHITSSFHMLLASMAFYASGQYSRAFVSIRQLEWQTDLAGIVSSFVRKRTDELVARIAPYLLADLQEYDDYGNMCEHAVTTASARAMSLVVEFIATGDGRYLALAARSLDTGLEVAREFESPSLWWIVRLLRLIIRGFGNASPWQVLPPYFPDDRGLLSRYIGLLAFAEAPIIELWRAQREAIPVALDRDRRGAVINLRTSAGKTRIAELAILQTLSSDPSAKVLYLAPFRSLALEVEHSLGKVFDWCGHRVSHLYGGFRVSAADRQMAEESSITIATPEKARAILRASPELLSNVKLIVVDEGHLIGPNERLIRNELFVDHLRCIASATQCKMLLLSAVLPNPAQVAEWVSGRAANTATSDWKPSAERFGLLRWQGDRVRIDWRGEFESFNPRFVQAGPLGFGRRRKQFPNDKNEAVAAAAVRLSNSGPVMVFTARANSVPGLAKAVLLAFGEAPADHPWPEISWATFAATCEEELVPGAIELRAARAGVICHSNRLPPQVRMATERLMRSMPPKIIIATTTLGQGVNVGISSVIVATPYISRHPIAHRDFWNICGRAGRAFVDGEGKVLYAIDETRKGWQIRKDQALADKYFDAARADPLESGVLHALQMVRDIASQAGMDFRQLMTMVAEDDFETLGENGRRCLAILDLLDDGLLALQEDAQANPNAGEPQEWIDRVFRGSLAVIQARDSAETMDVEEVLTFFRTRTESVLRACPDVAARKAYVATGLPLTSARSTYDDREMFADRAKGLTDARLSIESIIDIVAWLEEWARENARSLVQGMGTAATMELVRTDWIRGVPMRDILAKADGLDAICRDVYGFQLPWLIHAASQQLRHMDNEDLSNALDTVALLVELGLPSEQAAWVFLAGVRSRAAATEIAECGVDLGDSSSAVRRNLRNPEVLEEVRMRVGEASQAWLRLHGADAVVQRASIPRFPQFRVDELAEQAVLLSRTLDDTTYLCSPDGTHRMAVQTSDKWPFDRMANDARFAFVRRGGSFRLTTRDPRLEADLF